MKKPTMKLYYPANVPGGRTTRFFRMVKQPLALFIVLVTGVFAILGPSACAQNAAPADRNAVNTTVTSGGMMADSPVKFPATGPLPAKYPPDVREQSEPVEQDYFLFSSPCRSPAQIEKIQAEMPKGQFTPPPQDWTNLDRTRRILTEGGELRLLALGDSIVNDTMRSGWVAKLQDAYPKATIKATVYVRGGGGCQHYREEGRIAKNAIPRRPSLVFIGGISQRDIESIREVIHQLRAGVPEVEILLATGTFGTTDPRDPEALAKAPHSGTGAYGQALKKLAAEERCAYLDMTTPWAEYIRSAKMHPHLFYRDAIHANEFGEQILSKILMGFWGSAERAAVPTLTAVADSLKRGCFFAYLPDENLFCVRIDFNQQGVRLPSAVALGKQCRSVTVRVTQQESEICLLETVLPVKDGVSDEVRLALPPLAGRYEAQFTLAGLPEPLVLTKPFVRESFPWEGNNLGISGEIYPPYEPVKVDGHNVSVVLRRYTLNGFGLWDKLVTQGRDILAGPITLRYTTPTGEGTWGQQQVTFDAQSSTPQQAVFTACSVSNAVRADAVSTVEVDGCMKVEMDLLPGSAPGQILKLWIDIPLKNKEAPLFHEVSDYIRKNYSGFTPPGEGVVWDSSKSKRTARWQNPFTSYIWLGAEERGLCWFAENDRNWITEKGENARPVQELIRTGDTLTLRVYLVNTPAIIKEKYALVFGLQASPTKPMPENWRAKTTTMPGGSGPVNPWGGLHCGYKGPFRNDWQIVDKIIEAQKTGVFDEAWFNDYIAKYNPPPCYGNWNWLESCRAFARMRQRPVLTYQEELIQSVVQPEWQTFQDQWRNAGTLGTEMSEFTQREWPTEEVFREEDPKKRQSNPSMYINYCRSYQDYGCWHANEWFKRGVGAYWDNTFPKYTYNTRNSAAYKTADGQVQPAMVIWNERDYMKRIWNLLQYWRRHQSDPLEWSHHMTDALVLPFASWATVILDYELDSTLPFPPEMHRAKAIGRQVGAMPYWLFTPVGSRNPITTRLGKEGSDVPGRADWGMKMVHEALRTEYTGGSSLIKNARVDAPNLEKIVVGFGYAKPDTIVYNYWDERPAAQTDNDQVKWIVLARPQEKTLLLVLQSWATNDTTVKVTLDKKGLGFSPDAGAQNAETGTKLPLNRGTFSVEIPGPYGVRLVTIR